MAGENKNEPKHNIITKTNRNDLPIISFVSQAKWRQWLEENHAISTGIWLRFYKKASGIATIVYAEALEEALCYGWIDGQLKKYDENSYFQKFTPRRSRSMWSKRNLEKVVALEKAGKMKPAGLKEIDAAKSDGRWEAAYDSPAAMKIPDDFLFELSKDKKALSFFEKLDKTNRYTIGWRLQTARNPEIRAKRMKMILDMLARGEKYHG
jgi:uncharacterized protein YdeI (YjbR/CyaY-like superfamily)